MSTTGSLALPTAPAPESIPAKPSAWLVNAAFGSVYLIWGSTYLAMHVAVRSMPPFLMAGVRFLTAGLLMYAVVRWRGAARPTRAHWRGALGVGGLLLVLGNGGVAWAQKYVPTGVTALMIAATPLWMGLIEWLRPRGHAPGWRVAVGLLLGFTGVALIVLSKEPSGAPTILPAAAVMLLISPFSWSCGSIYSRHAPRSESALLNIAMQMICGGGLMLVVTMLLGEWRTFHLAQVETASWWAFGYLLVFGSWVAFTAYVWLLQVSTPARVSTYAYVNPLIAVLLGTLVLKEALPHGIILAGALILGSVVLLSFRQVKN